MELLRLGLNVLEVERHVRSNIPVGHTLASPALANDISLNHSAHFEAAEKFVNGVPAHMPRFNHASCALVGG